MADESGFFTPTTARGANAPLLRPGETIKGVAAAWLESYKNRLPVGYNWNWQPFFEALVEENIAVDGVSVVFPPDDGDQVGGADEDQPRDARVAPVGKVPKPPGSGSWNYTWYIPEWSHPDFDPNFIVSYSKGFRSLGSRDPVMRLYPALRPEDLVRKPTEWAKRFGIYPGELNGRSRLSPTLSATRDPWEDYANQVNLLSEEDRRQLSQETQNAAAAAGKPAPPPGYIDRDALETLMNTEQRMTGDQLRAKMTSHLTDQHVPLNLQGQPPTTLEEFVDDLRANYPHILEAHRTYFQKALDDQDYQRILFHDLTSDELVYNNIYTQSNSEDIECDLVGPIHLLLERFRWVDTSAKGAERFDPRLLYNINGVRAEWDVRTNDDLWNAMQPALQLLTKILDTDHPGFGDLMDLRTRYKIPLDITAARDNPTTPSLVGYRPLAEMKLDLYNSWPQMIELSEMGYDFPANTLRVLNQCLTFEISSAWFDPIESDNDNAVDGVKESANLTYGMTQPSGHGQYARINIWIAAELIWPLLVPQYSQSEKMTASFLIASTLMHEMAHAINCAHFLLTTDPYWAHAPGQPGRAAELLGQLGTELWDAEVDGGDPIWEGMGTAEVGFDLEKSVWGFLTNSLVSGSPIRPGRQISALPLIAEAGPWPPAKHPPPVGFDYAGPILDLEWPAENYCHPIPLEYMAQFFRQSFWTEVYPAWGPESMKLSPRDRLLKTSMEPSWITKMMGEVAYGDAQWWFISFVYRTLAKNNHNILAEYLKRRAWSIMLQNIYALRWEYETRHWDYKVIMPLKVSIQSLHETIENAFEINRILSLEYDGQFLEYIHRQNRNILGAVDTRTMLFPEWIALIDKEWDVYFSEGMYLMREASAAYRAIMRDISYLQRMVLDFLSLNVNARASVYSNNGAADSGPVGIIYRHIVEVNEWLSKFISTFNLLSNISSVHQRVHYLWMSWEHRYRSCHLACMDLQDMLGNPNAWQPDDMRWKRRFATVPSSYWKNRMDRLRVLAHRVYVQADPRVRHVFDECEVIMDRAQGTEQMPLSFKKLQGNIDSLQETINVTSLGHPPPPVQDRVYNWTAPRPTQEPILPKRFGFIPQPPSSNPDVAPKIPDIGLPPSKETMKDVFGVPRDPKVMGIRAPRRLNLPSVDTSSGQSREGIQQNRRLSNKGFEHWNQARDGAKFLLSAQKMNSLDALQQAGASTSASQNTTPLSSFGTGGAFANTGDTMFMGKSIGAIAGKQPAIFPNPFANPLITTNDAIGYDYQRMLQEAQMRQEQGNTVFQTTEQYREARATGFDDQRSDSSTPPGYQPAPPGP
ncbi:hypothetical protein F4811DRAFT_556488 [Daldinia bambusicola]|nr:hypothetical protein F4811DRAFT_556488 [Daldinia bambusicola]